MRKGIDLTFFILLNGCWFGSVLLRVLLCMVTDFIDNDILGHILYALTPSNRLACIVALETGLRIGDVLALKTADLYKGSFTITEQKTRKKRRVRLRKCIKDELIKQAGKVFVFEHRTDPLKHRTRQAVYLDLKRACKLFRLKGLNVGTHSLRKAFAVDLYKKSGSIAKVRNALNHESDIVTFLYAFADELTKKRG